MTAKQLLCIKQICMDVVLDEPMSKHTSFKIGGKADCFASPSSAESAVALIRYCSENNIPYYVIGNGSNLLVSDKGLRGVVIHIGKNFSDAEMFDKNRNYGADNMKIAELAGDRKVIACESGALLSYISAFALKQGLTGFEFASGIPGTVGGAAVMNAGAYDGEMSQVLLGCVAYDIDGDKTVFVSGDEQQLSYRNSIYQDNGYVVLRCFIALEKGNSDDIRAKINDLSSRRKEKQPLEYPSAGSTFKRPVGGYAAALIDECGLKGKRVGDACVSEKHAGFVVNMGKASCEDVCSLIKEIQTTVKKEKGVELKPEVKTIG